MEQVGYKTEGADLDAVFSALADPTRRAILARLAEGEASVGELAQPFAMSQPAVSKHLKVLETAGLVSRAKDRQRRPARLNAAPMSEAVRWLEDFRAFWNDSFDQLDDLLNDLKQPARSAPMTDLPEYVLERTFDAPPELVWRTWTEPELVQRWYGPGVTSIVHEMDVRPGGIWLHEMQWGGKSMFHKSDYVAVQAPNRLVMVQWSSTDAAGNPTPNQMQPDWPAQLMTIVTFVADGTGTKLRLSWTPHDATEAEIAFFRNAMDGLGQGWGAGMEALAALLGELRG